MKRNFWKQLLSEQLLTIATLASVVSGVIIGIVLRHHSTERWSERDVMYTRFAGEIFLRILKGLTLPLIISSLIAAIGSLDLRLSSNIGFRAAIYYFATTSTAVGLGILMVLIIQPGVNHREDISSHVNQTSWTSYRRAATIDTLLDLIRNMFPPNIVQACSETFQTVLTPPANQTNSSNPT